MAIGDYIRYYKQGLIGPEEFVSLVVYYCQTPREEAQRILAGLVER